MKAFAGDNPLKNSASYKITLKDLTNQDQFVKYLESLNGVRKVNASRKAADGIAALENAKANNGAVYNLQGQKVSMDAKGLLIKNGKKFFNK